MTSSFRRMLLLRAATNVIKERYIDGYINKANSSATITINGTGYTVKSDSSKYFKFSITDELGDDFVITSLSGAFQEGNFDSTWAVFLTELNLQYIGDLSQCTSMFQFCQNQNQLTKITFASNINTAKVKSLKQAFNGCIKLVELDLSHFNLSSIGTSGSSDNTMSSMCYMNETSAMTTLKMPNIPNVYLGSSTFENNDNITDFTCGTIGCSKFNLKSPSLSNASIQNLLVGMAGSTYASGRTSVVDSSVLTIMQSTFPNELAEAKANGWTISAA